MNFLLTFSFYCFLFNLPGSSFPFSKREREAFDGLSLSSFLWPSNICLLFLSFWKEKDRPVILFLTFGGLIEDDSNCWPAVKKKKWPSADHRIGAYINFSSNNLIHFLSLSNIWDLRSSSFFLYELLLEGPNERENWKWRELLWEINKKFLFHHVSPYYFLLFLFSFVTECYKWKRKRK